MKKQNISLHISNILKSGELEYSTVKENFTVQYEGGRKIKRIFINRYVINEERSLVTNENYIELRKEVTNINNRLLKVELDKSVVEESSITASDGKKYKMKLYNLDVIISVGCRVKSKRGIMFRKWAIKVLRDYLIKGYVINEERSLVTNENYARLINKVESLNKRLR